MTGLIKAGTSGQLDGMRPTADVAFLRYGSMNKPLAPVNFCKAQVPMNNFSIPEDFPLDALLNQELTQICIGFNDIGLRFYQTAGVAHKWKPGASIDIEAGFELFKDGVVLCSSLNDRLGFNGGGLTVLLRQSVVVLKRLPKNELSLSFSGGFSLNLITDASGFESYHLQCNGEVVDVAFHSQN